jgi:hypothetical protein
MIERRTFLIASGVGVLAVAGGGLGLALQGSALREPRRPLKVLDVGRFSVLAAVADAMCPGADGLPSAWDLEVPEDIDDYLAAAHPSVGAEIIQGLTLLENGLAGLVLDLQPRPFSQRSIAARDETLTGMATSSVGLRRTLYKGLLGLVTTTYWGNAATYAYSGYKPMDFTGYVPPPEDETGADGGTGDEVDPDDELAATEEGP